MQKIERIQERALRFILNDYKLDYESLLVESNDVTMEVKRMRSLCIEVFKTLNGLNPVYMNDIFKLKIRLEDPLTLRYQELTRPHLV